MKRALLMIGLLWLPWSAVHGSASPATAYAPASRESVVQLLAATQTRQLLDNVQNQVDASIDASMKAGLGDMQLTPSQRRIIDDMRQKMGALLREELSWERFQPMIVDIYRDTFSQREVNDMLKFYRSDAGKAVIAKLPRAMALTMTRTQDIVADMNPKMQKIIGEMTAALKADVDQQQTAQP